MLTLTTPITIPNITKIKIVTPTFLDDESPPIATMIAEVQGPGGKIYDRMSVIIRNGICQGIRAVAFPKRLTDVAEAFDVNAPTAYTDVVSAYNTTVGGIGARLKAVETVLSTAGILPAGTVS